MAATYSSGSTVVFKQILEATYGTLPGSPTMKTLRVKPSKFGLKKDTYTTDEVRADRGVSDLRHGMKKVEGTLEGDLMCGDWDDIILAALQDSAWSNNACSTGITLNSFCIEQGFTDINQFRLYKGCSISKLKLSIKPGAMVGISADFLGQDAVTGTVTNANITAAASSNSPFSFAGGAIQEGGTSIAYITGLDFELDNGLGQVGVVGSALSPAIFNGRSTITGTVTALFKDQVMLNKFINETESSLQVTLTDLNNYTHTITLPRIKYTGGDIAPPKDGATIITLPFEGLFTTLVSSSAGTTMAVSAQTGPGAFTLTRGAGSFITDGFKVGMLLSTKTGSTLTTPTNNGDWLITNVAATVITCAVPSSLGTALATTLQAAGAPGSLAGDLLVNPHNISWIKA